jgi:hypothetical protein
MKCLHNWTDPRKLDRSFYKVSQRLFELDRKQRDIQQPGRSHRSEH